MKANEYRGLITCHYYVDFLAPCDSDEDELYTMAELSENYCISDLHDFECVEIELMEENIEVDEDELG